MSYRILGELSNLSGTFYGVVSDGAGIAYSIDSSQRWRAWNLDTLSMIREVNLAATMSAITLVAAGVCSLCATTGSSNFYLVENSSGYFQTYATSSLGRFATKNQQLATNGDVSLGVSATAGRLLRFNSSTFVSSDLTPVLSGATANCVIAKAGTSNFYVGSTDGVVREVDSSGTTITTVILPTTPNASSAPTQNIMELAYSEDFEVLVISTSGGIAYVYDVSGIPSLVQVMFTGGVGANSIPSFGCVFSQFEGDSFFASNRDASSGNAKITRYTYIPVKQKIIVSKILFSENASQALDFALDTSLNKLIAVKENQFMQVISVPGNSPVSVQTRAQDPEGVNVGCRIIRIRDLGKTSFIESDQDILAGVNNINSNEEGQYIELAIINTSNPFKWDIREFST